MEQEQRVWCYFRNLVHTVYREARHIGPAGDGDAKLIIQDPQLKEVAKKCSRNRAQLKATTLFRSTHGAQTTDQVLRPYVEMTGLSPAQIAAIFHLAGWKRSYGGPAWATITEKLIALQSAIEAHDAAAAITICEEVKQISHNSGKLVPTPSAWQRDRWLQEKWPQLCD